MRIEEHPILKFDRGKKITFYYNGEKIEGYDHNTVFKPSIKNTLLMFYKKDSE